MIMPCAYGQLVTYSWINLTYDWHEVQAGNEIGLCHSSRRVIPVWWLDKIGEKTEMDGYWWKELRRHYTF